jgi:hypothetical protein
MSFEDEYVKRVKARNPLNAFLPVLGLFLAAALGVIAWILSDPVHDLLAQNIAGFPGEQEVTYVIAGVLFLLFLLFAGLLYSLFMPKNKPVVTEHDLLKERERKEKEKKAMRRRKRKVAIEMAKARRENQDR